MSCCLVAIYLFYHLTGLYYTHTITSDNTNEKVQLVR